MLSSLHLVHVCTLVNACQPNRGSEIFFFFFHTADKCQVVAQKMKSYFLFLLFNVIVRRRGSHVEHGLVCVFKNLIYHDFEEIIFSR